MKINWNKCSDQMPPNADADIIVSDHGKYYILPSYMICRIRSSAIMNGYEWTQYTEHAWKELNGK